MTTPTTPQEKKKWLIEKLSDKTLSFGCIIEEPSGYIGKYLGKTSNGINLLILYPSGIVFAEYDKLEHRILGHPIGIARVLSKVNEFPLLQFGLFDEGACFYQEFKRKKQILCKWDLAHDNLEEQSDETIDYLYNLFT